MAKWTEEQKEEAKLKREEQKRIEEELKKAENIEYHLQRSKDDSYTIARYRPLPPTRMFKVGDEVSLGNLNRVLVKAVECEGRVVLVEFDRTNKKGEILGRETRWEFWSCVYYPRNKNVDYQPKKLSKQLSFYKSVTNREFASFCRSMAYFGYDDRAEYQRELVWTLEEKQSLIRSILIGGDIGKLAIIKNKFTIDGPTYEILDGKQRLNAMMDFLEGRFQYEGLYFHEMNFEDMIQIRTYNLPVVETEELTREQRLEYFLTLNTGGAAQEASHIQKVEELLESVRRSNKKE